MQKHSLFHDAEENLLKAWHTPYAKLFGPGDRVLDVGCGLGSFADLLRDRKVELLGLDIDPAMVAQTRAKGHQAIEGEISAAAEHIEQYSGIHISHVVEHLWGDQVVSLLETCLTLLKPGGILIIRTPNWTVAEVRHRTFWLDHTHRRPYPPELLSKILKDLRLEVVEAGSEPYGVEDVYVIARKPGERSQCSPKIKFGANPFLQGQPPVAASQSILQRLRFTFRR